MYRFCVIFVLLASLGCGFTPEGDAVRAAIKTGGAKAADESLVNALWFICYGASFGSIKRRFGDSREQSEALRILCDGEEDVNLVGPPDA